MNKVAKFFKVSEDQFIKDWTLSDIAPYNDIVLPKRSTMGSAGYDFYSPMDFTLSPGEIIRVPTGIRAQIADGWVLILAPRSGQGFKYRLQLYNTVGVIDSDYFGADNEGHIQVKLVNANTEGKTLHVKKGEAFVQGIFLPFGITEDDESSGVRIGGFGSTTR